jgi:hypothetical protein
MMLVPSRAEWCHIATFVYLQGEQSGGRKEVVDVL